MKKILVIFVTILMMGCASLVPQQLPQDVQVAVRATTDLIYYDGDYNGPDRKGDNGTIAGVCTDYAMELCYQLQQLGYDSYLIATGGGQPKLYSNIIWYDTTKYNWRIRQENNRNFGINSRDSGSKGNADGQTRDADFDCKVLDWSRSALHKYDRPLPHMWVMVMINGEECEIDPTWSDGTVIKYAYGSSYLK